MFDLNFIDKKIIDNLEVFFIEKNPSVITTFEKPISYRFDYNEILDNNKQMEEIKENFDGYYYFDYNYNQTELNVKMIYSKIYTVINNNSVIENIPIYDGWIKLEDKNNNKILYEQNLENNLLTLYFKNEQDNYIETKINLFYRYIPVIIIEYNKFEPDILNVLIYIGDNKKSEVIKAENFNNFVYDFLNNFPLEKQVKKSIEVKQENKGFFIKESFIKIKSCYKTMNKEYCVNHADGVIEF